MAKILQIPQIDAIGNLFNGVHGTKESIEVANSIVVLEKDELTRNFKKQKDRERKRKLNFAINNILSQRDEIGELLDKVGLSDRIYYPFKREVNKNGENVSVPKGNKDMKKDVKKSIAKLKDAREKKKISDEEYERLIIHLKELVANVAEEELVEEVEEEMNNDEMINEERIEELYEMFNDQIEQNKEDLIELLNSRNGKNYFEKEEYNYENADLNERKDTLKEYNSEINKYLGIAGDIRFTTEKIDLAGSFNSKFKGYYISEHDLKDTTKDLNDMVGSMMEKSMVRAMMEKGTIRGAENQLGKKGLTQKEQKALYYKVMGLSPQEIVSKMNNGRSHEPQQSRQRKYAG